MHWHLSSIVYTVLTKVGLLAHVTSILSHALSQEALRLGIARAVHLATDFGHCIEHGKLGSCCRVGLEVL